ncbi:hypothetical protein R1sor_002006 [Riccia sorocarpa]|uniref:FCP1 homology domain-containing protein n=1 Tax=Riccia sorocarpa TaxID=122646 RepID=A0ABD3H087_9MARC
MFRDAFFIPEELNPPASSHPFPKHVMRSALEDWFSRYDEKMKRYLAEDCVHEEWRPVFQCLQTFLLAKRRLRSISGPIIHFVKSALEPVIDEEDGEEDTSMIAHPKLLDLAGYQFKCVRDEMMQVKKHLEQPNNSRLRETFMGQVLTHLLIHLGIYKGRTEVLTALRRTVSPAGRKGPARPCARLRRVAVQTQGRSPPRALLRRPDVLEPKMQQRLLHALQTKGQMDIKINAMKAELAELERLVAEERRLLEETAHRRKEEERRLETLGANVYQPRLVDPESVRRKTLILAFNGLLVSIKSSVTGLSEFLQACLRDFHLMIWTSRPRAVIDRILRFLFKSKKISFDLAHHECFELGKTSRPLYYKDFDNLYEYNISARDVLIVEDEVAKISTNNLMNALATVYFIEETRPWATLPWVEEPVEALMKWWGPDIKKTKTWTDVLFRSCTFEERKTLWQVGQALPSVRRHELRAWHLRKALLLLRALLLF